MEKDIQKNTITVAAEMNVDSTPNHRGIILLKDHNWIPVSPDVGTQVACVARIRYRGALQPAVVQRVSIDRVSVTLSVNDEFIAAGQSMVFYEEDRCLGGGVIER